MADNGRTRSGGWNAAIRDQHRRHFCDDADRQADDLTELPGMRPPLERGLPALTGQTIPGSWRSFLLAAGKSKFFRPGAMRRKSLPAGETVRSRDSFRPAATEILLSHLAVGCAGDRDQPEQARHLAPVNPSRDGEAGDADSGSELRLGELMRGEISGELHPSN